VSNNTISGLFGSGIYTDVVGAWIHHNYLYDLGSNGIFIGYSAGDTLVEYNYIRNASVMPTASYGSGGVYFYGQGWSMQRHVIRNNWIFSTYTCFMLNAATSNQLFENNICHVKNNQLNSGRYNVFKNNLYLGFWPSGTSKLGEINMFTMVASNFVPSKWVACRNALQLNPTAPLTNGMPWQTHVYPNGTQKSAYKPWEMNSLQRTPSMAWSTWCTPTTAGPKNVACGDKMSTYKSNGTSYPFPCELLPSNNRFGSTDYVGWTVVYNTTTKPLDWNYGYATVCNVTAKQTAYCPSPATGWAPYFYDVRQKVLDVNWFNSTWYKYTNSTYLFGTNIPIGSSSFTLSPKTFSISPQSKLARDNPALLRIPISQIGLFAASAPTMAPL